MSNTTSTGPRTAYVPSPATGRLRTLAVAAVAALGATIVTLSVVDTSPEVRTPPASEVRPDPAPAGVSDHDSGIEMILRERGAGG